MEEDKANKIAKRAIASGDMTPIIRMGIKARIEAEHGNRCQCSEPSVRGLDLMCGNCLLENKDQEVKKEHYSKPQLIEKKNNARVAL